MPDIDEIEFYNDSEDEDELEQDIEHEEEKIKQRS